MYYFVFPPIASTSCWIWQAVTLTLFAYRGLGATFDQNFDFKIRRDNKKKSYERRVCESVDDNSLS